MGHDMEALVWETAEELDKKLAERMRRIRRRRKVSQQKLSDMSGVSYGSIKRFETTGQISLLSLRDFFDCKGGFLHFICRLVHLPDYFWPLQNSPNTCASLSISKFSKVALLLSRMLFLLYYISHGYTVYVPSFTFSV